MCACVLITRYDVVRNYNEANFYVNQVHTLQKKARDAKSVFHAYIDAKHSG